MRIFWRILAAIGGVVALLLIAVAIAVRSVDVNDFIRPLQQRVKDATGRDLTIRGGIDLKLGLTPSLVIDDVSLGNASWGKQPQMVTAKKIEAEIALLPLLRKRFEIVRFRLVEPTIALETDSAGKGNWEFPSLSAAANASTPARSGGTLGSFLIGDLAISDGALTYRDGKTGEVTTVIIEDLSVHARDAQSPISGRFRGTVNDTKVALEGDFGPLDQLLRQRWPYPVTVQGEVSGKKALVNTRMSVQGNAVSLDELQLGSGTSRLTGQMTVTTGGPRPKLVFKLAAPTLTLTDLALTAQANLSAVKTASKSRYVFSDAPTDVAALNAVDATGELAIDKLLLPDGRHLDQVRVQLSLQNGQLDVPVLQMAALGGSAQAHMHIDASRAQDPAMSVHLEARDLDLAAILGLFDVHRQVRGGKTEVKADITTHGASPRQWASDASGSVTAIVGPASLANSQAGAESALDRLTEAVNPFGKVDPSTELQCAVVRLPLKNGVATIDRSIAVETSKVAASASGTLDFRSETLDLAIKPQIRQGIPINASQVAELVRFRGPFIAPSIGIDTAASVATVARLGAAASTGGLSIVGESLLAPHAADSGAPCQVALGRSPPAPAARSQQAAAKPEANVPDDVSKALGRLLGR
jgi:uncharacterized protein involved in outer membrane biogenesis